MPLASRAYTWRPNDDGTADGHYPLGDKGPVVGTLSWNNAALPNLTNKTTGTPYSANIRTLALQGSLAAAASLSLIYVSGAPLATIGWTQGTDNLDCPGNVVGVTAFKIRATAGLVSIDSNPIASSWVAPAATDTQGPTAIRGFSITPGNGLLTFRHRAPYDAFEGVPASLVKDLRIYRNGVLHGSPITTGVLPGISPTFQLANIGNIVSPSVPTAIQSGKDWTITAAGTGVHNTQSDQCAFLYVPVNGDFELYVDIDAFSFPSNQYATVGGMLRESLAVNAPMVCGYMQPTNPPALFGNSWQFKRRAGPTVNSANRASDPGKSTGTFFMKRVGNVVSCGIAAIGGGVSSNIIDIADAPMQPAALAGIFVSSQMSVNPVAVTGVFRNLCVTQSPELVYNIVTALSGTWTVRARDLALNEGVDSLAIAATPLVAPGPVFAHRWPGGHFVFFTPNRINTVAPVTQTLAYNQNVQNALFALFDELPIQWAGVALILPWKEVEGPTRGNYTRMYQVFDPIFARANLRNKKIIIQIFERGFVGNVASITLPEYIISSGEYIEAPGTTTYSGGLKCCAAIWHAQTMTDFINLGKAFYARYGDNVAFALYCGGETTLGFPTSAGTDFTQSAYDTQLKRAFAELKATYLNVGLRLNANYWDTPAGMKVLIDYCHTVTYTGGVAMGGPDPEFDQPLPANLASAHRTITFNEVFRGNTQVTVGTDTNWQQGGGTDYRGRIPCIGEWQEFGMADGRAGYNESVADIYNGYAGTLGAQNKMNCSIHIWLQQNYKDATTVAGNQRWAPYPNSGSANGVKYFVTNTVNGAIVLNNPATFEGNWVP